MRSSAIEQLSTEEDREREVTGAAPGRYQTTGAPCVDTYNSLSCGNVHNPCKCMFHRPTFTCSQLFTTVPWVVCSCGRGDGGGGGTSLSSRSGEMARTALWVFALTAAMFLVVLSQQQRSRPATVIHASSRLGQRPSVGTANADAAHPAPRARTAVDALDAVLVAPPDERPEVLWLRSGPTPVADARFAAKTYFKDMLDGSATALPDRFDAGVNPCWGGSYCLPAFLILGVYQSGVRDLYSRLSKHSAIAQRPANSPSFYSQVHPTWSEYIRSLGPSSSQALNGKLLGEASAVTFHFVWVHQEKLNQPYVDAMGRFWRACNGRSEADKAAVPHRECMAQRMADGREADAALARKAGMPMIPDGNQTARERRFSLPQLMRAVYGGFEPSLIVLLRQPWHRMHAAYYKYVHYARKYGNHAAGEVQWAAESISAFRRCEANFTTAACALSFESLTRDNEEVFYHCDQLIKGMYIIFLQRWRREFRRLLLLRSEDYYAEPLGPLTAALRFLGLSVPSTNAEWHPLLEPTVQLAGSRPPGGLPPLPAAMETALRNFYAPRYCGATQTYARSTQA